MYNRVSLDYACVTRVILKFQDFLVCI